MQIRNQCPLCCTAHTRGAARLCPTCNRYAWAVDILGVLSGFACVAFVAAILYLWN